MLNSDAVDVHEVLPLAGELPRGPDHHVRNHGGRLRGLRNQKSRFVVTQRMRAPLIRGYAN